ncbi:MAG: LytR C-terminal domain-containing protein [Actinomycetota bacterium]|nr:LytR C-terminal domain-containing protein [Actinomycetota bacterium]
MTSLATYLILLLLETIKEGFVSFFFNLNILLVIVLVSGVIAALTSREEKEEVRHEVITLKELGFIIGLGILGAILIWYKTAGLGNLSRLLSFISGILIILLSILVLGGEKEEVKIEGFEIVSEFVKVNYDYVLTSLLVGGILFTAFFGNISIFGFVIRLRYLLILYFIFCWIYKLDYRFSVVIALPLLLCCSLFLMFGDVSRASLIGKSAYVFLGVGVFLWLLEYAKEKRISEILVELATALLLLLCCPIFLMVGDASKARLVGMLAYAFFALVAASLLIEYAKENEVFVKCRKTLAKITSASFRILSPEKLLEKPAVATEAVQTIPHKVRPRVMAKRLTRKVKIRALAGVIILFFLVCLIGGAYATGRLWFTKKVHRVATSPMIAKKPQKESIKAAAKAPKTPEAKVTLEIDKSKVKIDVLNGNGVRGEATSIASKLSESGFSIQTIGDAGYDAYPRTVIRHKPGQESVANLVAKEIEEFYPALLYPNLSPDLDIDIALILGRDRKGGLPAVAEPVVDKSKARIDVLNGNGITGSAKEIADLLRRNGFNIRNIRNADSYDYAQTIIRYRSANEDVAQLVADQIKGKYSAILKKDSSIQTDIIVILGRR